MGLKPMSDEEFKKNMERAGMLTSLINNIDWSSVQVVSVEWGDDSQVEEAVIFGEQPGLKPPTKEIVFISIYADPGTLPIPRKDGRIDGEGVFI